MSLLWVVLYGLSCLADGVSEQGVEGRSVLAVDVVLVDVEVGEERLVEKPADVWAGHQVGTVAVAGEVERAGEVSFDAVELGGGGGEPCLDGGELVGDALLFAGDEVERHCLAVDGFEQLLALVGEFGLLGDKVAVLVFRLLAVNGKLGA